MKKQLLLVFVLIMGVLGLRAQSGCTAPTGLTVSLHSPNWQNINLNWNPVVDPTEASIMWSTNSLSTRIGANGPFDFTGVVRFETTDLANYSGRSLTAVTFAPGEDQTVCTYSIRVWQGGSYDSSDSTFTPGTMIVDQLITTPLTVDALNTVLLDTPVSIDPTQELWIGIRCNTTDGYPLGASGNGVVTNKGELIFSSNTWETLTQSELTDYNWIIVGTLTEDANILSGYNVYRDDNLMALVPSTSFADSVANGTYTYDVTALYANGCESAPISVDVTMADNPCVSCMDSVIVGTGSTGNYILPMNTYYNYSYTQQIYTAAELGNIDGGIPCIAFDYIYTSNQTKNVVIYMGNTTKSSFASSSDWVPVDQMYQVFSGNIDFIANSSTTPNWVNIPLNFPFEWDGSSNIVVAVLNNTGSYVSSSSNTFSVHTATSKSLYIHNDSSPYNASSPGAGTVGSNRNNIRFMVGDPITCPMPSHYTVSNVTHESAELNWWSRGVENYYEIVIVPEGSTLSNETPIAVYDTNYVLTGLTDNTQYTVYMHSLCSGDNSSWLQVSFRTSCLPVTTLPIYEDFSSYTPSTSAFPNCWYKISTTQYPYIISTSASGTGSLYFYSTTGAPAYAVMQPIDGDIIDISTLQMKFKAQKTSATYGHIEVGVMTDPTDPNTFTLVKAFDSDMYTQTSVFEDFIVYFNNYTGNGQYIAFRSPGDYASYTYIDDIEINYIAGCGSPTNLTINSVAGTSAMLSWQPSDLSDPSDVYTIEYSVQGMDSWNSVTTNNEHCLLSGLDPETNYEVMVYVTCDNGTSDTLFENLHTACLSYIETTIGTNTTTSTYIPSYSFYGYSYTQELFLASEFSGPMTISALSLNMANLSHQRTYNFYLMHTNVTNLSSFVTPDSAQLVFAGQQTLTTGWNKFEFNAPFAYNGTDNLLLIAIDQTGSYVSGNSWYGSNESTTLSRYIYQDGTPYSISTVPTSGTSSSSTFRNQIIFSSCGDSLVTCVAPAVFVNNVTNNSAELEWAPGYQESSWELEYKADGDADWTSVGTVTTTEYLLDNLTASTSYSVRLRSDCGGEYSGYTMVTFETPCDYISTLPFTENFDSYTATGSTSFPTCWNRICTYSNDYPYITNSYAHSGSRDLYFYNGGSSYYAIAALPRFDDQIEMDSLIIEFYSYFNSTSYYLEVGIMSDPTDGSTFTPLETIHPVSVDTWEPQEIVTRNYSGNGHNIAFRLPVGISNYAYIDDINIENIPTCPHVSNLAISNVDSASATISWTSNGNETEWEVIVLPAAQAVNVDFDTCASDLCYATSFDILNLQPSSTYTVFVRANCDAFDQSSWMSMTFQTTQIPAQLPFEEDFEGDQNWGFANGGLANQWCIGTGANNGGTHALYISNDNGATNSYNISSTVYVWAFRDIYFPASPYGYQMSFDWRSYGESCCDYMRVYIADPSDPTAGTTLYEPAGAYAVQPNVNSSYPNYFNLQSSWSNFVLTIPGYTSGGVKRIYFLWHNDSSVGTTPPAAVDNISIATITCPAPTNVNVSALTPTSADVSWTEAGAATDWVVQYRESSSSTWIEIPTTMNPTTLSGLTPYTNYTVRVIADCGNGENSPASGTQTFQTPATCPAPSNFTISGTTSSSVDLDWTVNGSESDWVIIYGTTGFSPTSGGTTVNASTHPYSVTNLSDAITYDFYVKADCGGGDESVLVGPITTSPGAINMPISGSQTVTACGGTIYDNGGPNGEYANSCSGILTINPDTPGMMVQLTGTYNTESCCDDLTIYDGASTGGTSLGTFAGTGNINVTSTTGPLTLYFTSDGSVTNPGFALAVTCVQSGTPTTCDDPTNVQAAAGITSATITWNGGSASAWNVQYRTAGGTWSNSIPVSTTNYTITGFTASTAYEARVQAVCDNQTSNWVSTSFTTVSENACPAPTNFHVASQTVNTVTLAWDQEAGTATEWEINYKANSSTNWTNIIVQSNPYAITDLITGETYQAQILAHCSNGNNSDATPVITFTVTGIDDYMLEKGITLMPNPATNYVDVLVSDNDINIQELQVYDVYGKLLQTIKVNSNPTRIDISNLASGMYMVRILGDNGIANKSFIKK